jgi:hypothetical protein
MIAFIDDHRQAYGVETICRPPINRFSADHTEHSRRFEWIAHPDKIVAAVRRGHQVLASSR